MAETDTPTVSEPLDHKAQDAADDADIAKMLAGGPDGASFDFTLPEEIDQTGKADDAEDFEDISDDDLPDEEPSASASLEMPALTDDAGSNEADDDLFGDEPDDMPTAASPAPHVRDADVNDENQTQMDTGLSFASINFDPEPHSGANQDANIPDAPERDEDLLQAAWPAYEKGKVLQWSVLLPNKKATWKEKKPGRKPKQLVTSKLTLEVAPDQEKHFRIPGTATASQRERYAAAQATGFVICDIDLEQKAREMPQFDIEQESDSEAVGGFTLRDIEMACVDWEAQIETVQEEFTKAQAAELEAQKRKPANAEHDDEWDAEFLDMDIDDAPARPKKRMRTIKPGLPDIPRYNAPSFDNFEEATQRGAKRVHLETDDPYLLLETQDNQVKRRRQGTEGKKANGKKNAMPSRFNLSNDDAYELLKENHQSKVRATLGNISVEHGMPALKLTWPYFQVKFRGTTDEYHRPKFRTRRFAQTTIRFDKLGHHKRKLMKGKAQDVYRGSKDLSISDNGTAVLFEYCEPRPRVLNGFGMGNKIINYYRRKDATEDDVLEKRDLGEYRTLLPEDRSPFSLFGTVDPGETVPTLHNEMYRAPVFRHSPRNTDFLMVRNTTGMEGSKWYLHKIDHLHVVGQQFPSVEVPGPHSRKVTNASKNRMKMLAYRLIRHSRHNNASLSEITRHIAESTDTQNRQKLKEFLQYDRESQEKGTWKLRPGEVLPDEAMIRAMIKPEDVQMLDAMQLGMKELEDAGYDPRNANIDDDLQNAAGDDDDDDGDEEGSKAPKGGKKAAAEVKEETLADKLAPWKTTKAFIDATQSKAMLQLHGEGDPTGHGLGFSFIRTSMKGGYIEAVQGPLATSADAMEREKRANGGHAYNVKKQQAMYEEGIREIWEKQKSTLSDPQEHDDKDVAVTEDEDDRFNVQSAATPAQFDEGASQISGLTASSRHPKRAIRIMRTVTMPDGSTQERPEVVHDPVVITQYMKRRTEAELENREYVKSLTRGAKRKRAADDRVQWLQLASKFRETRLANPSPGSIYDLVGIECRMAAYTLVSAASTAPSLRVTQTTTALQTFASSRNSTDSRRIRHEDSLASSRRNSRTGPQAGTQGHQLPVGPLAWIKSPGAPLASVPIVARSVTSRPIRSTFVLCESDSEEGAFPDLSHVELPSRDAFEWMQALREEHIKDVGGDPSNTRRKKDPQMGYVKTLAQKHKQIVTQQKRDEKARVARMAKEKKEAEKEAAKRAADEVKRLEREKNEAQQAALAEKKRLAAEEAERKAEEARVERERQRQLAREMKEREAARKKALRDKEAAEKAEAKRLEDERKAREREIKEKMKRKKERREAKIKAKKERKKEKMKGKISYGKLRH